MTPSLTQRFVAEVIGTFFLVIAALSLGVKTQMET